MKNKILNILVIGLCIMMFGNAKVTAKEMGSVEVTMTPSTLFPKVGSTIYFTIGLENIIGGTDGIAGFGAELDYDRNILDCNESVSLAPFSIGFNSKNGRIGGFAMMPNERIQASSASLIKISCNVLSSGRTWVYLKDTEVSAGDASILESNDPSVRLYG